MRLPPSFQPACHAHTHTLTFKMVKMVESADEFKALKMGDKPVRTRPGSAPRLRRRRRPRNENVAHVSSTRARGFFVARGAIVGSFVAPAPGSRARSPRSRVSPGRLRTRAPASPIGPFRVDAAPIAKPTAGLNERTLRDTAVPEKTVLFSILVRRDPSPRWTRVPRARTLTFLPPLLSPPRSSWWTSPRRGAARAR